MKAYKILKQHNQRLITIPKSFQGRVKRTIRDTNKIVTFEKVPDGTTGDDIYSVFPQGLQRQCKVTMPPGAAGYYLQVISPDGNTVTYQKINGVETAPEPPKNAEELYKERIDVKP